MPLYRPSELRSFLDNEGLTALRSLSQNFLIDGNVVEKIGKLLDLKFGEAVVEIGPGPGVVTEYLCSLTSKILTVEKDAAFAKAIERFKNVKSLHADALKLDIKTAVTNFSHHLPIKLVSNLPYASASAFMELLMPNHVIFSSLTLMLPRSIGDKMQGRGQFHWLCAAKEVFCHSVFWQKVNRRSFYPMPQTDSVLAHFKLQSKLSPLEGRSFLRWLKKICAIKKRVGPTSAKYHTPRQRASLSSGEWIELWRSSI